MTKPRVCGNCTACCTVLNISELNKPAHTPCPSLCTVGHGCSLYGQPERDDEPHTICRTYECLWLSNPRPDLEMLRPEDRPDITGVLLQVTNIPIEKFGASVITAHELYPGARNNYRVPFRQTDAPVNPLTKCGTWD